MPKLMNKANGEKMLHELHRILSGEKCFLIQGTALGAYRDKGFCPSEADIDIGFLQETLRSGGANICKSLILDGFEVKTVNEPFNNLRAIRAFKYGVKADLNGFMLHNGKRFCNSNLQDYAVVFEREVLENTKKIKLFGDVWSIPTDTEKYLELEYGKDWRTPQADSVSRSRVYGFIKEQGITNDFLD